MLKKILQKECILLFVFAVACIMLVGCGDEVSSKSDAISVKAEDMLNDYIKDQEAADKKYNNKTVNVTGQVLHKNQFSNSTHFLVILAHQEVQDKNYHITIAIPSEMVEIVNKAEEGKYLSVEGICVGVVPQENPKMISIQIDAKKIHQ